MSAYSDQEYEAAVRVAIEALRTPADYSRTEVIVRAALDAAMPRVVHRAKADAWAEGYAVASDDFTHSDYCGTRCQCEGIHGQTNPYLPDRIEAGR